MKITYQNAPQTLEKVHKIMANLPLIKIEIKGHKFTFLFDTGASMTILSESTLKAADVISEGGDVNAVGNLDVRLTVGTKVIQELKIGEICITECEVMVVEDSMLDFGFDFEGNSIKVDGFLGWDVIQHFCWELDRKNDVIEVSTSKPMVCEKSLLWDNMPIIPVKFGVEVLYFGIDTGNTESMLGVKFKSFDGKTHIKNDLIVGLDGRTEVEVDKLEQLRIQICQHDIVLNDVIILDRDIFPTDHMVVYGLLASDILMNKVVIIDYPNCKFSLIG